MSESLEEEMRRALFGTKSPSIGDAVSHHPQPVAAKKKTSTKPLSPKLRVTLKVTKIYEGPEEVFVHDANTLSKFMAESEAKAAAKMKKFRYFELVSVEPVQA